MAAWWGQHFVVAPQCRWPITESSLQRNAIDGTKVVTGEEWRAALTEMMRLGWIKRPDAAWLGTLEVGERLNGSRH